MDQNFQNTPTGDNSNSSPDVESAHQQAAAYSVNTVYGTEDETVCPESRYNQMPAPLPGDLSREDIANSAQQLIDDLNTKRKRDTQLMDDYKKALEIQVQKCCSVVEQRLFHVYEEQGKMVQDKLQTLFAGLDRISKVEGELTQFKQALQMLYRDLQATD
ncbi:hypothetical protein ScPMuIL_001268 [Solemya velum]